MAPVKSRAVVLRRHRLGETSCVVVCYTRDYGKVRLVAKGVRKGGGRFGAALDPFVVSGVVFYLRPGRDLSLVSQAETEREFRSIRGDVLRQAYAAVALELVERLVAGEAPDPALFDAVCRTLAGIDAVPEQDLKTILWSFELGLAERLGYAPELDRCASCGRAAGDESGFSIESGGVVCPRCARTVPAYGPDVPDYGPDVVDALRTLRAGAPGDLRDVSERLGDEIGRALLGLMERHSGRSLRLRSQAVLESLERTGRSRPAP
ncbi:MAG: DNA repair protein RecO [Candidatus Eisenbacteria bacterium]|nr:DNA repair protein RecO [Candidatus Eisenbacteria bacterium]